MPAEEQQQHQIDEQRESLLGTPPPMEPTQQPLKPTITAEEATQLSTLYVNACGYYSILCI